MYTSFLFLLLICYNVNKGCGMTINAVGQSVGPSITPVKKMHSSSVFGHNEILYWNRWSTNLFWEPLLLLCCFICLLVRLSLHICHMFGTKFKTRGDTAQTHHCPVGLILFICYDIMWLCIHRSKVQVTFQILIDIDPPMYTILHQYSKPPRPEKTVESIMMLIGDCHGKPTLDGWNSSISHVWKLNKTIHHHVAYLL